MERELAEWAELAQERSLKGAEPVPGKPGWLLRGGKPLLDLSSNDYLGLSRHPDIAEAMRQALLTGGAGAGASRLMTGNREIFAELEGALADWQQCEASLVVANGYMANVGVVSSLVGRGDAVFSDRLNHASLTDGIALSRAAHYRYRHNDVAHLAWLLEKNRHARRKLIVTDTIFSMDGDRAPLAALADLKRRYGAMLMVDEAHSGGLYGGSGEGLCRQLGIHGEVDAHVGTFGKAFGVYGAYVSGSRTLIRYLMNKMRPFMYSTAMPPSVAAGAMAALTLVRGAEGSRRRGHVHAASLSFRGMLSAAGFQVGGGDSPIVPIVVGDNETALRFAAALEDEGIAAVAIRPPTVPAGHARIRFSLSAAHADDELAEAARSIDNAGRTAGIERR
ncbi:8-amino-7-oxononanoate synthase [Paenibacillus arenilitoris]|uniref:8-amino-7-ketopelargonate synthase n=1 Tax=Paenibacillus arenilitoris TaxID=2772299 RepID=A0A927H6H6_9BACL|nr:8-amino-7-oxononanoate synthase [Paenibacillus arenilitoris]MBD2869990.1 8-amino-7-oxononanoate synthase [Paenibacillus arenilitoris]